jgi:hypothetical protein
VAAPTYFDPIAFEGSTFLDGGLGTNNPSFHGYVEVHSMHSEKGPRRVTEEDAAQRKPVVSVLISTGTGRRAMVSRFGNKGILRQLFGVVSYAQALATDGEETNDTTRKICEQSGTKYFRFNVNDGLENIGLDGWIGPRPPHLTYPSITKVEGLLAAIEATTMTYLATQEVQESIKECANVVMMARRFRASPPITPLADFQVSASKIGNLSKLDQR